MHTSAWIPGSFVVHRSVVMLVISKMTNHRPKVWSGVTCCYRSRGEMLLMLGSTEGTRGKALIDTDEMRMVVGY